MKTGDVVECVRARENLLTAGRTYKVAEIWPELGLVTVLCDSGFSELFDVTRFRRAGVAPENRSRVDAGPRTL